MNTVTTHEPRIRTFAVTEDLITADLVDGRRISVPLCWSWRLAEATPTQRQRFEIMSGGRGVRWPELDEDISVRGMLQGVPARRPQRKFVKRRQA